MSQKLDYVRLRRRSPWTTDEGEAVVAAFRSSGESVAAFARSRGLGPERLRWWCKRLRSGSPPEQSISLVPVTIVGGGAIAPTATFDVAVAGVVVRVPPDFDEPALRRLVQALTRC